MSLDVSVIIPAHDEAGYITGCLDAVLASDLGRVAAEVIVVANGCTDDTAVRARDRAVRADLPLHVIETPTGDKLHALRLGDEAAVGAVRVYLDADVTVDAGLIAALVRALATDAPRYGTGSARVLPARRAVTRAYGRFWQQLPFVRQGAPGFGCFAVNAAGRRRWGDWPAIISDDTFVRLSFAPDERVQVAEGYGWPLVEGWRNLVRVRRRQNRGVAEIAEKFPALIENDTKPRLGLRRAARLALQDPVGFGVYASVALMTRLPGRSGWTRGR